jgi:hypothetical protein
MAGLLLGSQRTPAATPGSLGLGELNAGRADSLLGRRLPDPNAALNQFVVHKRGAIPYFNGDAWSQAVLSDPNWDTATWEAKWWTSGTAEDKWWTSGSEEAKWWTSSSWEAKWWTSAATEDKWWTSGSWEAKWWTTVSDDDTNTIAQSQIDLQSDGPAQADASETGYLLTKADYLALFRDPFLTPASWEGMALKN